MRKRREYAPVSVFRNHPKIDDAALIRLVYYFSNGISVKAVAGTLGLSPKSVRAHYLDLRARLKKPKFARWHSIYTSLVSVPSLVQERMLKAGLIEALAVCYASKCYGNYASGNRKNRMCRRCPLPHAFTMSANAADAIGAVDEITAFYRRLGIRGEGGSLDAFFERFLHTSVIACVREHSRRLPNGLLDPADTEFQAIGTLIAILMDDLSDDHTPKLAGPS